MSHLIRDVHRITGAQSNYTQDYVHKPSSGAEIPVAPHVRRRLGRVVATVDQHVPSESGEPSRRLSRTTVIVSCKRPNSKKNRTRILAKRSL